MTFIGRGETGAGGDAFRAIAARLRAALNLS